MTPVIRGRRTMVTDEPQRIAPELMGRPLGSVRRRFAALALDSLLCSLVTLAVLLGLTAYSVEDQDPGFLGAVRAAAQSGEREQGRDVFRRLLIQVTERRPDVLTSEQTALLRDGDTEALGDLFDDDTTITYGGGAPTRIVRDGDRQRLEIGNDVLLGRFDSLFGWGAFYVGWFTLWTRVGRGRTLGKLVFGLRVVRLDGRKLSLWDSFGRAGGYAASAATLLLGFLEAVKHPNRQAMHDKISGTVVLRVRKGSS